jgi:tRNA(Ile)-lysidine synthase
LVAALSGGADSVALTHALARLAPRLGFRLVAAHFDHGLRPDSPVDADSCAALCAQLGVELRLGSADVRARARNERRGLEDAARRERYAFLGRVVAEEGASALAVAHTRDDQAETLLLRLLRGAGRRGLASMRERRGRLLRPLLGVSRAEVLRYLGERGLSWREDPTNADPAHLRNRVRHELIPLLEARFNPRLRESLVRTAAVLHDEDAYLESRAARLFRRIGRVEPGVVILDRAPLARAPRALARLCLRRALRAGGGLRGVRAVHVERLLELARASGSSGRRIPLPGAREASVLFRQLRIGARPAASAGDFAMPLHVPGRVSLPDGRTLVAETSRGPAVSNGETAVVAVPEEPLTVRTRRPGDRVRVRGRSVSLKRFLMDRRVAAWARSGLPVVAAGSQVLFVAGQEVDGAKGPRYVKISLLEGHPA